MIVPTQPQLLAALTAARQAIQNYSSAYSHMIADDVLIPIISDALTAALNVPTPKAHP